MFRYIVAIAFFSLWKCACLPLLAAEKNSASSEEVVDDSREWDFGQVKKGTVANHDFIIKNTKDRPLFIKDVSSSCGCTVSEVKKYLLAAGEETVLAVQFNSADYDGKVQQFVYVATDDPDNSVMRFIIKATVVK